MSIFVLWICMFVNLSIWYIEYIGGHIEGINIFKADSLFQKLWWMFRRVADKSALTISETDLQHRS